MYAAKKAHHICVCGLYSYAICKNVKEIDAHPMYNIDLLNHFPTINKKDPVQNGYFSSLQMQFLTIQVVAKSFIR